MLSPAERLRLLMERLEDDPLLFQQDSLSERLLAMDEIDALVGGCAFAEIEARALALQNRLESANAELYRSLRSEIRRSEEHTSELQSQ